MSFCVCAYVCARARAHPLHQRRLQTASVQRIFRRRVVVGPGRILRVARSLNPPDPFFLPPSSPSPLCLGWGRRRKLLLCSTFAGNDPATRMRDPPCSRLSWFPSQARGKTLFQTRTRDEPFRRSSVAREDPSK